MGRQRHHTARELFLTTKVAGRACCTEQAQWPCTVSRLNIWLSLMGQLLKNILGHKQKPLQELWSGRHNAGTLSAQCCLTQCAHTAPFLTPLPSHSPTLALCAQVYHEPVDALVRLAFVHPPAAFQEAAASEDQGNDVFVCEYEYDQAWKRFRVRTYPGGWVFGGVRRRSGPWGGGQWLLCVACERGLECVVW